MVPSPPPRLELGEERRKDVDAAVAAADAAARVVGGIVESEVGGHRVLLRLRLGSCPRGS